MVHIDWAALGIVAVVSIVASVAFVALLAVGVRCVSAAKVQVNQGGSGAAVRSVGYGSLLLAAVLVAFGLYLIVPQLH